MQNESARDAIERLEEEIERLSVKRERCRKLSRVAKIAIALGAAWLAATLLGLVPFLPGPVFAAIAATIGGVVLLGSNATTWDETDTRLRQTEAERARLIDATELRLIDGDVTRVH